MESKVFWKEKTITKRSLDIIQINLGDLCNLACTHCHIEASPKGKQIMTEDTAEKVLQKLLDSDIKNVEFTGGAPEMNPGLPRFIEKLSEKNINITVRTNLTILEKPGYEKYYDIFKKHKVKLVASLPAVFADATDRQRGRGVFDTSVKVIRKLNDLGYGSNGLTLDFVYNPVGEYLPPPQFQLEQDYKQILTEEYDIHFNNLATIVNSPIKRYRNQLLRHGTYDEYLQLLKDNYNSATLERLMCRNLITVDFDGNIYDCDFNLAMKMPVQGYENVKFWDIDLNDFYPEIAFADHCYACTVNNGSSCHGVLLAEEPMTEFESIEDSPLEENNETTFDAKENAQKYYGQEIQQTTDLKTSVCCNIDDVPEYVRKTLPLINDEIKMKYYGCGTCFPEDIESLKILDVGCGTGRDVYIMSKLVGPNGFVYGIDMTSEQIKVAQRYIKDQTKRFGYNKTNVKFIHDYMENISGQIEPNSLDLVTSNCVINLAENKEEIIRQIYEVLKEGGELYFSDVYADRRLPEHLKTHPVIHGECLGGALYIKDFERVARRIGFSDLRIVSKELIEITDKKIADLTGNTKFYSITYRLWKIDGIEDACEDFGHVAVYRGGIPGSDHKFELDEEHIFEKDRPERICGNTALMLSVTRLKKYFEVMGSFSAHFGSFESCGTVVLNSGSKIEKTDNNFCSC